MKHLSGGRNIDVFPISSIIRLMNLGEIQERFDVFIRSKGLRRTNQRELIVAAAFESERHFTAEELWERARKVDGAASRATVYRTLALLVESGLLQEIDLGKDFKHYDPNFLEHPDHNHLICVDCDKVVEFEDNHINLLEDCITKRLGFTASRKSIRIEARCEELQRSGSCRKGELAKAQPDDAESGEPEVKA